MSLAQRVRMPVAVALLTLAAVGGAYWWFNRDANSGRFLRVSFANELLEVGPGVYLLGRLSPAAAYVVKTSDGVVLIDAGLEADAVPLLAQLGDLGIDVSEVRAILLTHCRGEHALGARILQSLSGAKVYAGRADAAILRAGGPPEQLFAIFPNYGVRVHATPVDVDLDGGETIAVGDVKIEAIATPGHTQGGMCYALNRGGLRILFSGDTISTLVGDMGTHIAYHPPRYGGDAQQYLTTLRKLREQPAPDLVLPGHPLGSGIPNGPHLTAAKWQALLDRGIQEMEQLVARYETDGADFLDGTPRTLLPGLHYLGDYAGQAVYAVESSAGIYLFNAPGDDKLADFVEQRLEKLGLDAERRSLNAILPTSCDPDSIGGLVGLTKKASCPIVVSDQGRAAVLAVCPPGTKVIAPTAHDEAGFLAVRPIALSGRGVGPIAYLLEWHGKQVLLSGRIPIMMSDQAVSRLFAEFQTPAGNPNGYAQSIYDLQKVTPDLWLPAEPLFGQNANLYGDSWSKMLAENLKLVDR